MSVFKRVVRFEVSRRQLGLTFLKARTMPTLGISSRCADMWHVLFLDYDNIKRGLVEDEYLVLQAENALPPGYLFASKEVEEDGELYGNYHVICLVKLPLNEVVRIQGQTHCDLSYRSLYRDSRFRSWVLRQFPKGGGEKVRFLTILGEPVNFQWEVSSAHLAYLKELYPEIPDLPYMARDGEEGIFLTHYKAAVK